MSTGLSTLLFYAYTILAAPWFAGKLRAAFETGEVRLLPGLVLLFALGAETVALPWTFRSRPPGGGENSGLPLALGAAVCITHVLLASFLVIYALDAFGLMGEGTNAGLPPTGGAAIFTLLLVREGYLFFASGAAERSQKPVSKTVGLIAGALLLLFRCIAYTAYWDVMMGIGPVGGMHWAGWIVLGPALILVFYILYLPIRMTDLLEAYRAEGPAAGRAAARRMLVSGALLALYPIFGPSLLALVTGR